MTNVSHMSLFNGKNGMLKRYTDIDCVRGFGMLWVVWYHTTHPGFVDYPFFLPVLFFVSGIFYKDYPWEVFWRKKVNQFVIPYIFFYLSYYAFLLLLNLAVRHSISNDILFSIFDAFRLYTTSGAGIVNYPMWFVMALLVMQFLVYGLRRLKLNKMHILCIAFIITYIGRFHLQFIPTPFQIGHASLFFFYYAVGITLSGIVLSFRNYRKLQKWLYLIGAMVMVVSIHLFRINTAIDCIRLFCEMVEFTCVAFFLFFTFNIMGDTIISKYCAYIGRNSLIVLGLHDMYLTIVRIGYTNIFGAPDIYSGFGIAVVAMLLIWPSIYLLINKFPMLVGKKNVLTYG